MPPAIAEMFQQIKAVFAQMTTAQKLTIGSLVLAAIIGLTSVALLSLRPDYRVAHRNLSPADASAIADKLDSMGVPYRLRDNGSTIEVPRKDVARVRMTAAGEGLIRDSSPGWELFDNLDVGLTDTLFAVKKQRAIEGELERDISTLEPVEKAHVTLSLPTETVFARDRKHATASVVLQIRSGWNIAPAEVAAVIELVRTAVGQGMSSEDITVLDQHAHLLSKNSAASPDQQYGTLIARQKEIEEHLAGKAEGMLAATIGAGKASVRVAVTLIRDEIEELTETHDPESRVIIKEKVVSSDRKDAAPMGDPTGIQSKIDPQSPPPPPNSGSEISEDAETEYTIDTTTRKVKHNPGGIARLTVGMFVDQSLADKIVDLEEVVKTAVGFDMSRGDVIKTTALPFSKTPPPTAPDDDGPSELVMSLITHGSEALTVLAVLLLLRTLFLRRSPNGAAETRSKQPAGAATQDAGNEPIEPSRLQHEITQAVEKQPETAAQVLHSWLYEEQEASS